MPTASTFDLRALNFPEQFTSLRPAQEQAIEHVLTSTKRFPCIGAPPGVGKSALAWALANILGGKTVILTATLGLQDQYLEDFASAGLLDIRGRSNFRCWEGGNCETGLQLGCRERLQCPYSVAARAWWQAEIGVANYAWWMAVTALPNSQNAVSGVNTLICDEAHLADEWLSRSLDFWIGERECRFAGLDVRTMGEDCVEWNKRGGEIWAAAIDKLTFMKDKLSGMSQNAKTAAAKDLKRAEGFVDRAAKLAKIEASNWVVTKDEGNDDGRLWRFECIWPGRYREQLFQGIERVVLMSATLRPKTMQLLGISSKDYDFREWGRQFPAKNGPVIWVPTTRVRADERMSPEDKRMWLDRHVELAQSRDDRKGLAHTKSYGRAKEVSEYLRSAGCHVEMNGKDPDSPNAREAFDRHVRGPHNSILVSPSFGTGWDFKGKRAEWQAISKIPLPDMRSKLMQARRERDGGYEDYLAAQELVQQTGRVVRSETDRGETFILDDTVRWWAKKAEQYLPKWWGYRKEDQLPRAPEALAE
jgi:Rad3-related DNA helicase